jgi:hypothetical protein
MRIFCIFKRPKFLYMKSKTLNLLSILANFGMITGGILSIFDEDKIFTAIGIYFIAKRLFVIANTKVTAEK